MFKRTFNGTMGCFLLLLLWHGAPVLAQPSGSPFQVRVTGTCASGSSIRVINADGSVVCQADANSGGTVTSVGTGSGLTGGPITNTGTISIPTGGVTSAHIADGTIGSVDVDSSQIQQRVTGTCASGSSIRVINADGSVVCQAGDVGVTAVTASSPLVASGTTTRNIALPDVIIGPDDTAIGTGALVSNTPGTRSTASGSGALGSNTTGGDNTAIGFQALQNNTTGGVNTAIGARTLVNNTTGQYNTAIGVGALFFNTTGSGNTASGLSTLERNTTGEFNTATGFGALGLNTTGSGNTASGVNALAKNHVGEENTAIGATALQYNITSGNTAIGFAALQNTTLGHSNTASGDRALFNNTTGQLNTAIGLVALYDNTTGGGNTAIGVGAGGSTTGNNNTAIGRDSGVLTGDLVNATAIGAWAVVGASNKIRLGNSDVTVIEGQVDFSFSSDQTRKENFQPVDGEAVLRKLRGLNVTSWNYIGHDPKAFRHYGPMGQDFFAAFGHDGIGSIGTPTTLTAADMAGILMSAVQAMERRTVELRQTTEWLKETVEALKAENAQLKARLERPFGSSVAVRP
jgi:hypothetical protein